jgi:putative transposase
VIEQLRGSYSDRVLCAASDVHRSSLDHPPRPDEDRPWREALIALAGQWPTYGDRRSTVMLRREGHTANAKRVRRLMSELDPSGEPPPRHPRTTNGAHAFPRYPNLVESLGVVRPDQVRVSDITYIRLKKEFIYLAVLMDVFSRSIRGWNLGRSPEREPTLVALGRAMERGKPEIHHSDQGVQDAATAYVEALTVAGTSISMAAVGEPRENGYAERLMRTITEEEVDLTESEDFADASRQRGRFLDAVYDRKRIHSPLGYLTPSEFEQQWIGMRRSE